MGLDPFARFGEGQNPEQVSDEPMASVLARRSARARP